MEDMKLYYSSDSFYADLLEELENARDSISMMYFAFDSGWWSKKIISVLEAKQRAGVKVRLMVDELGMVIEVISRAYRNRKMLNRLQKKGVQVDFFKRKGSALYPLSCLHVKFCIIDNKAVFIGSSNIGDNYIGWSETNLRIKGNLNNTLNKLYDYVLQHSCGVKTDRLIDIENPKIGESEFLLTVPGRHENIRKAMLELIQTARERIYIRTWYFLPDREILEALLSKLKSGIELNLMLSHNTRSFIINGASLIPLQELVRNGAKVHRYDKSYMHSKVAWNDRGLILLGSANLEDRSLKCDFECCLHLIYPELATQLTEKYELDRSISLEQDPVTLLKLPFHRKIYAYACIGAFALLFRPDFLSNQIAAVQKASK